MATRRIRPKNPLRSMPGPTLETIQARAENATSRARLTIAAELQSRTKVRGVPPGFRAAAPPWYAMLSVGTPGYREIAFSSNSATALPRDNWGDYFERCLRYDVFWAHYEGNVYSKIHQWAEALKEQHDLYDYVRTIFSPAYRIGEFWTNHLMGGTLDEEAGDGKIKPSAIPIITKNDKIRPVIAQIWRDSNWQIYKDKYTRFGSILGDVGLMVVDDEARQKVYFRVIHPRTIISVTRDPFGNIKGYVINETRLDPRNSDPFIRNWVTYGEVARRRGDYVEFSTYLDGNLYDWRDYDEDTPEGARLGPIWTEKYGFIPLVLIPNKDTGHGWGWSEIHQDISKLHELDDLASKLSDQIRKIVDTFWFCTGCGPEDITVDFGEDDPNSPDVSGRGGRRDKQPILFGPVGASMQAMIAQLDVADVSAHIRTIKAEIEADHPELASDNVSLDASGEARKVARQVAEAMVFQRRATYDDGMVRAQMMAISIGAMKGYPGFDGFSEDSFTDGELSHSIGARPVFAVTQADRIADAMAKAAALQALSAAGMPLKASLRIVGFPESEVDEIMEDARVEAEGQVMLDNKRSTGLFSDDTENTTGNDAGTGENANEGSVESAGSVMVA